MSGADRASWVIDRDGYILSDQPSLFGQPDVVGFARGPVAVREVDRNQANATIVRHHYSHRFYSASTVHLEVFRDDAAVGVLQFGFAMNPASAGSVVEGTAMNEYLVLNRMWLSDDAPKNTESAAIGAAMSYIRRKLPLVGWVQSFADERCGLLGVVYQAAGFMYCGCHVQTFWELDGQTYHNSLMTRDPSLRPAASRLQRNADRATKHELRQFRYIRFLRRSFRRRLLLPVLPYPKANAVEGSREIRDTSSVEGGVRFPATASASREGAA